MYDEEIKRLRALVGVTGEEGDDDALDTATAVLAAAGVSPQDEREHCVSVVNARNRDRCTGLVDTFMRERAAVRAPLQLQLEAARAAHGQAEVELARAKAESARLREQRNELIAEIERLRALYVSDALQADLRGK